ncbi:MAG: DNA recombination protein RmuC [Rickettsiaceae bacterium]|nr:DNA recombination protein RmuC [Rickettsiaceae bacterium]
MLKFAVTENAKLNDILSNLSNEKIQYIKQIQDLTNKVEYLTKANLEQEKARKEAFDSAKASLFDLGAGLSKQLIELHKQETLEARQNSEKNITTTSEKFHKEFEKLLIIVSNLSKDVDHSKTTVDIIQKSLLSPGGAGKLAEITLENILKSSGLKANLDFTIQHDLKIEEGRQRPDALIFLPSDNLMVVDAKASKFLVELSDDLADNEKSLAEKNLMRTMYNHLKALSSREYAENTISHYHLKSKHFNNVITLMFLPTESALERITALDHEFIHKAWAQNIFPVGPTGLMNMLSFAKFQINDHMRSENHKVIIEEVRKLLLSVSVLSDHSQKLGANIKSLVSNYDKFSASFNRNFLPKARNIRSLGVDVGKQDIKSLDRYHLVSSESDLIEVTEENQLLTKQDNNE